MEQEYPKIRMWMGMPAVMLEDETALSPLQQKIMHNGDIEGLLGCRSILVNGERHLVYPILAGCAALEEMAENLPREAALKVVVSAAQAVREVLESGYLQIENLVLEGSGVYVEKATSMARLIYLPIDGAGGRGSGEADERARSFLAELLEHTRLGNTFEGRVCLNYLGEKKPDVYEAVNFVRDAFQNVSRENETTEKGRGTVCLISESPLYRIRLKIVGDSYTIGREGLDGSGRAEQIRTVSARHCEILRKGSRICVKDLDSTNGTYLNGKRLEAGREYELKEKDMLRIANVPFRVHIEGK